MLILAAQWPMLRGLTPAPHYPAIVRRGELFGLLFLTRSAEGREDNTLWRFPGESHIFRWRELYFSTYDLSIFIMIVVVWTWLAWRVYRRLRTIGGHNSDGGRAMIPGRGVCLREIGELWKSLLRGFKRSPNAVEGFQRLGSRCALVVIECSSSHLVLFEILFYFFKRYLLDLGRFLRCLLLGIRMVDFSLGQPAQRRD